MSIEKEYRVIGFAGCGQQALIAACTLFFLKKNKKVLLMDYSKMAELRSMISLPRDLEEIKNVVVSYRNIDYIKAEGNVSIEDVAFDYDVILVDFGTNLVFAEKEVCDEQYYITDMRRHNVLQLKECSHREHEYFVLKHFFPGVETLEFYAEELKLAKEELIVLPYKEKEIVPFLSGTHLDKISTGCFSQETKRFIKEIVENKKGRKQIWS